MRPTRREFLAAAGAATLAGCATTGGPSPVRPRIWDNHCHLGRGPGRTAAERAAFLLSVADRMGIEKLCVHLGLMLEGNPQDPTPEHLRSDNDAVLKAIEVGKGRILGYVYLNPNHLEFSLRELDRCVRDGPMVGVKLWVAKRCSDPALDPIVKRAAELQAPIYQHTWMKVGGNDPGESSPLDVMELARRHPGVQLMCGHSGGDWERGIRAIRSNPNVLLEIAGSDPCSGFVEMAVRELGADRIVYGSDVGGRSYASQLAKVHAAAVSEEAKAAALGGNLRRLLGPILKAKGLG
jgi:predicted TIM-barrel fold metal-dependent hydrolase